MRGHRITRVWIAPVDTQAITLSGLPVASRARLVSEKTTLSKNSSGKPFSKSDSPRTPGNRDQTGALQRRSYLLPSTRGFHSPWLRPNGRLSHTYPSNPRVPIIVLRENVIEKRMRLLVILCCKHRKAADLGNVPSLAPAQLSHCLRIAPMLTECGFLPHTKPIKRILIQIE